MCTSKIFYVRDDDYPDATAFKNSLSGVYLIYELETPITPTITKAQFDTLLEAFGINGITEVINLGGTYYGGYVEQDKDGHRKLVVTHKTVDLSTLAWTHPSTNRSYTVLELAKLPASSSVTAGSIAEKFVEIPARNTLADGEYAIILQENKPNFVFYYDGVNEPTGNLVYELAEPIEIELPDGEPIITFNGDNNIYNDSGTTTVQYTKPAYS